MSELKAFVEGYAKMIESNKAVARPPGLKYSSFYDFVARNGKDFEPQPLPKQYEQGEIKMCYENSLLLAVKHPELTYCEGYAAGIIPVAHAWCIDQQGKVVDPTWHDGRAYFGVPINTDYAKHVAVESGYYGVIDQPHIHYPILKDPKKLWKPKKLASSQTSLANR